MAIATEGDPSGVSSGRPKEGGNISVGASAWHCEPEMGSRRSGVRRLTGKHSRHYLSPLHSQKHTEEKSLAKTREGTLVIFLS